MIDFRLEPYEWQRYMRILLQNVSLNSIDFLSDHSILFKFLNSYDGNPDKNILCHDVWKFYEENCFTQEDAFPYFICDVRVAKLEDTEIESAFNYLKYSWDVPESNDYNLVCMSSGDVNISLICKAIEVI